MRVFLRKLLNRFREPVFLIPGLAGMALVSVGAGLIYWPAGLIIGGLLCLRVDSRL
jgi:hypothetical protein